MKAEITQNKKAFEPIEVKITIESLEELECVLAMFNIPFPIIKDHKVTKSNDIDSYTHGSLWDNIGSNLNKIHKGLK